MDARHPLKALLQLQLGSDSYAVLHLPYILDSLTAENFAPSPHLTKWTARINSLLHAKTADARWAGLCLAQKSGILAKPILLEYAQSWIGSVLPLLSKQEPVPVLAASIRLLRILFTEAADMPEFQRQVATPNVAKFTTACMALVDKQSDVELRCLILSTLTALVIVYPTLHRTWSGGLSTICLGVLNGSPFDTTEPRLVHSASCLYATLPLTGGKVGAVNLWRKAMEDSLSQGWNSFYAIRTTFSVDGRLPSASAEDPRIAVPLNLDRLKCSVVAISDLLKTNTARAVQIPLGALLKFALALVGCLKDEKVEHHIDYSRRDMEASVTPHIWKIGSDLIIRLAECLGRRLTPNATTVVGCLVSQLEQSTTASERLSFLVALEAMLFKCLPLDSPLLVNGLAKTLLPFVSVLVSKQDVSNGDTQTSGRSKKGKKRAREFEGDELFNLSRDVICPTAVDGKVVLASLAVLRIILRNHTLSPALHSISSRVVLSIMLKLPQISAAAVSADHLLHGEVTAVVQDMTLELSTGSTGGMSKSLGLVINSNLSAVHRDPDLEILLHPRLPPLLRSLPWIESLSLSHAEESQAEAELRQSLGLASAEPLEPVEKVAPISASTDDLSMSRPAQAPTPVITAPVFSAPLLPPPQMATQLAPQTVAMTPAPTTPAKPVPASLATTVTQMRMEVDDDENEEMPVLNMDSDSEDSE
ncbi:unnamed protein product [Mycena citricolor]|uniref:Pre-rRNA-processing protein RIX1 n=1 Tax=Mycena citricolor TaxID=2018698 RepID=A0AAD2HI85_9AGAR|nr:unnamed protein product [Mycena citricolor]